MIEPPDTLHRRFQDAFNRRDLEAIVALYEPAALLLFGGAEVRGLEAIRDAYRTVLSARPTIALETVAVHHAGDLALLHGRWTLEETGPDGPVSNAGRNTETARRQPDGRWLFVIDNPSAPDA